MNYLHFITFDKQVSKKYLIQTYQPQKIGNKKGAIFASSILENNNIYIIKRMDDFVSI